MHAIFRDAIYALRKLTKSPGFTFLAVVTLALGIGLNSAVFSVVNAVLFRPLPVESPGELVNIYTEEQSGSFTYSAIAFPDYLDLIEQSRSFEQLAAYTSSGLILEHGEKSEGVLGEVVSGNYFDLLGVEAALGRTLTVADDRPGGGQQVAVLGYSAWQRRFGGDPGIVGQDVRLNGHLFQVVGVAPPSFFGMLRGIAAEVWIPMRTSSVVNAGSISNWGNPTEGLDRLEDRARRWHFIVGRLAEGVSAERARAEVAALGARWQEEYPVTNENRFFTLLPTNQVRVWPGLDQALYTASFVVMGIVALVLLIACANLANMLLARAVARRKEMATRLALGASRGAIIRQLLIESLTLSLLGGGVGILVALASNAGIERLQLPFPVDLTLGLALDYRVALFTLAMSSLAAIVFGLAPAF
ncbi:MAG: ABC transporter permease, partial [Acidobacteriota bacterium]